MSDADKQTSEEVAHEAEDVRADLAHTLEQLRENLKPEHVIEEVVSNARVGANTLADGLYAIAKDNPIPALLIGAGCAMVFGLGSQLGQRRKPLVHLSSSVGRDRNRAGASEVTVMSPGRPPNAWLPYRKVENRPGERFAAAQFSLTTAQDKMTRSSGSFTHSIGSGKSRLADVLRDQPLIIAALGVAVGAAIGAALPGTDVEDDWMGETSASVKHAAQEAASAEIDELRGVAGRAADNMKQSVAEHGLSADNLSNFVGKVGDHAKAAIHDVGASPEAQRSE